MKATSGIVATLLLMSMFTLTFRTHPEIECGYGYVTAEDGGSAESLSLWWQVDIAGAFPGPLLVDDVDGDGVQEIIGFSNTGRDENETWHGYVFTLDPSSRQITWQSQDLGAVQWHNVWHKLRVVDLDGDGEKEIVVCVWRQGYPSGGFWSGFVYVFDGKTRALLWKSPNIGGRNMDLAIADLDDDGIKEIIAGGNPQYAPPSNGRVYVFDGANFTLKWETGSIGEAMAIIVDDLDGDDAKEVLIGTMFSDSSRYYVGYLHVFNGINGVLEWRSDNIGNVVSIVVDDVDMDGTKEVIAGTSYQRWDEDIGYIHIFDAETKDQEWKSPAMKYVRPMDICDVDDDGTKEIVAGTTEYHQNVYNGHLHVFDGVTHEQELDAEIGNVPSLAVDDVDNDGIKEIVTASSFRTQPYTGYLRVFDGKHKTLEWISENINPTSMALADLDEQGPIETIVMGATEHTCILYVFAPGPPAPPSLSIKLSGEHDYLLMENVKVRLTALVKDAVTMKPVSDANVTVEIYDANGTLWVSDIMMERIADTGIYEWESQETIRQLRLGKGVYLVHARASLPGGPTAADILQFHVDPPSEGAPSVSTLYVTAVIGIAVAVVGLITLRRSIHRRSRPANRHLIRRL